MHSLSGEERANTLSHGAGVLLSLAGLVVLLAKTAGLGDATRTVAVAIYGVCTVLVYVASTLCHFSVGRAVNSALVTFDHCCVYLAIAGTYTPFMLVTLRGALGNAVLVAVWVLATAGILYKTLVKRRSEALSLITYLLMGWLIVATFKPFAQAIDTRGLVMLVAGGAMYSLGVVFFAWKRLAYGHAIWHLFVLAGSAFHYAGVLLFLTPT